MQRNCQGIRNKVRELHKLSRQFDILLLVETFLKPTNRFLIKNFNIIRAARVINKGVELAILIRKGIRFFRVNSILNITNSLDTLSNSVQSASGDILITTMYRAPSKDNNITSAIWSDLFDFMFNINRDNVVIAGEFNCHNAL